MEHTCPICGVTFELERPPRPSFPFCSTRCKMVDLGNWIDERYRIPEDSGWESPGDPPDAESDLAADRRLH